VRGVDPARVEGSLDELVAWQGPRPRAGQGEQEREYDRPSRQRDRRPPADDETPAGIDEQHVPATRVLDGEEVGRIRHTSAQEARDGERQLALHGCERPREQLMWPLLQGAVSALERGLGGGRSQVDDRDFGLGQGGDAANVGREVGRAEDLLHGASRFSQTPEQHLGASDDEALHRRVAPVSERVELLRRGPRGARRRRGIARAQGDLDQGRARARPRPVVLRDGQGALERAARHLQIPELRIRDAAQRQPERSVLTADETQGAQSVAAGERAAGVEEGGRNQRPLSLGQSVSARQ
jgi:hypothetical protein